MSRFWPHAEHAEDQRFPKSILTAHSLDRGLQAGTVLGIDAGIALAVYQRWQQNKVKSPILPGATGKQVTSAAGVSQALKTFLMTPTPVMRTITNAAGVGALGGLVVMAGVLPIYMRGKTHIEWQDRSWRLLASEGQVEVDDWSWFGAIAGAGTSFVPRFNQGGFTYLNFLGRGSVGGIVGIVGYMGWRYGVMGGKRKNDALRDEKLVVGVPVSA